MQSVSARWKEIHTQAIIPRAHIEIEYKVSDPDVQPDASATDNGHMPFSNTAQIVDGLTKAYKPYITLEHNNWILNGNSSLRTSGDTGFVSDVLCDTAALFTVRPVISINFSIVHTKLLPGLTIQWSYAFDECARAFKVTAYNGAVMVATTTITENTENLISVDLDISNYNKIEIEIIEWCLPGRRARVEDIVIGIMSIFRNTELLNFEHSQFADPLSGALPKAYVTFEMHNTENEWNPDNPQGRWRYLIERQEISVRYGYNIDGIIEWIDAGKLYMSEWETPSNGITAQFTARDLLEFMQSQFIKTVSTLTLYALAEQALTQSNIPIEKWFIDDTLKDITVTLPNDFAYTNAEVVQLCANAARCAFYQDRQGIMRIAPISAVQTDYEVSRHVSYANADYEYSKELKSVSVNNGMGTSVNSPTGEVQTAANPLIQNSTVANAVADWARDYLRNRKALSGEYRADPRLDALDVITVSNKYATNTVLINTIKYRYSGLFKGEYKGRVMD